MLSSAQRLSFIASAVFGNSLEGASAMVRLTAEKFLSDWAELAEMVYGRFPDGYFPGWLFSRKDVSRKVISRMVIFPDRTFPGKTITGWSLSRKNVSRVVIFPDDTFPGKTSWMVGLIFNCICDLKSYRTTILRVFKWIYSQFAPLPIHPNQLVPGKYGASWYPVFTVTRFQ